ncbi:MAG: hypothetical protein IJ373_01790 [Clostridia bacterium]|nr:hypothetical protein [Clostridia bacterium]MBQ8446426.1 hypothetical protein [Clostridia bacterium]
MIFADDFGFLPENSGTENAKALQAAVDNGGEIRVRMPGVYDLSEPIALGNDTTLIFEKGVTVRRQPSESGVNGNTFINKGLFDGVCNTNIRLIGLHLLCNGVESTGIGKNSRYVGLRAQVGFINVKDLVVDDFDCRGLLAKDYALQVGNFENIRLENLFIEGDKDGVHLAIGKNFVIRHAKFRTFDDPIALNAFDYSVSNTHVGWIENGLIEDCYDLDDDTTTGYFCRMLGGSWLPWFAGMPVHHSDTVCYNGRIYRVVMNPTDGKIYTSNTPPTHERGYAEYDGIGWVCTQEGDFLNTGCRNILFRNIYLQKKRTIAMALDLNHDTYAHSCYPGSVPVPHSGIVMENVSVENEIEYLLRANYPTADVTIRDTDIKKSKVRFERGALEETVYPKAIITLKNVRGAGENFSSDGINTYKIKEE